MAEAETEEGLAVPHACPRCKRPFWLRPRHIWLTIRCPFGCDWSREGVERLPTEADSWRGR